MKKIVGDFRDGIGKIRWFSSLFAERMKVEIAVFRVLYDSDKLAKARTDLLRRIGERVIELKNGTDRNILKDHTISGLMSELEKIEEQLSEARNKAVEISRAGE